MATERNYNQRYSYGTAAPVLKPSPRRGQAYEVIDSPVRHKKDRSNLKKALFIIIMSAALIGACIFLLSVRSEITSTNNTITSLQSELQILRADNDAKEIYLNKSIDLTEIYNKATEELGMTYPSDENVIFYHRSDGGYVRQYEEIPTE